MGKVTAILIFVVTVVTTAFPCPVSPPCQCKNETNPYTRKLEYIADCSNLGLTTVPTFVGGETVDRLLLNGNKIIKVSNNSFNNIIPRMIDLSENGLDILTAASFFGLQDHLNELDLGTNNLVLPLPALSTLRSLQTLNLDFNPLNAIRENSFIGMTSLTKLVLTRCNLETVERRTFSGLTNLKDLDFYGNVLSEIPPGLSILPSLQTLNFDANIISKIDANSFQGLHNLKELQLSRNSFTSSQDIHQDAFSDLNNLEKLGFFYDKLGSVPSHLFAPLKKLANLDISYCSISQINSGDFGGLTSLKQLDVSGNGLRFQPGMFKGIDNTLEYILIRSNGLTALPIQTLSEVKTLKWIDAASSDFPKDLPPNFVSGLPINRISLMWMNLTSVRADTFSGLRSPLDLDIFSNALKSLDFVTDFCQYTYISISENPINCDCHVYNLTQAHTTYIDGTCASPPAYQGLTIRSDKFQELAKEACKHLHITGPVKCPWS